MYTIPLSRTSILMTFCLLFLSNFSFAHWSTRGPYGGHVSCFAVIDTNVFVASPSGGVYRSTNTQLSAWRYYNYTGLGSGKINALIAMGNKLVAGSADKGIYISNDLGNTWTASSTGLSNLNVLSFANTTDGKLYAGTNGGGVFVSADSGATWTATNAGLTNLTVTALIADGATIIAGTSGGGVFANVGTGWFTINTGLTDLNITTFAADMTNSVFCAGTPSGVFLFDSNNLTWSAANVGLSNTFVNTLYVDNGNFYAGTNAGVFSASSTTLSWTMAGTSLDTVKAIVVYGTRIVAGTQDKGAYRGIVGTFSWTAANSGYNNLKSYAAAAKDSLVVVANEQGVFVCKNFVVSPIYIAANNGLADSLNVNALVIANGVLFAATSNAGVFMSTDTGATWTTIHASGGLEFTKLLATSTDLYIAASTGEFYTAALSSPTTWVQQNSGLPANATILNLTSAGSTIFAALGVDGLYANTGGTWTNTGLSQTVTCVAADNNNVYAGTAGAGVFKSALSGFAWTAANTNLLSLDVQALLVVDAYVVVGYQGGAMASCNGAATWHDFNILQYIPNYADILAFVHITPRIFALTPAHGLYGNSKTEFPVALPDTLSMISGAANGCVGAIVTYSVANDVEATSYTWSLPSGWSGSSNTHSINTNAPFITSSGVITVTASNGCGSSPAQTLNVSVNTVPNVDLAIVPFMICSDAPVFNLTQGTPAGGTYSGTGVSGTTFNPATAGLGIHTIVYTFSNGGCTASAADTLNVVICMGVENTLLESVQLFPNPVANDLMIQTNHLITNAFVHVFDNTGKIVKSTKLNNDTTVLDVRELPAGLYGVRVTANGTTVVTAKIVKIE